MEIVVIDTCYACIIDSRYYIVVNGRVYRYYWLSVLDNIYICIDYIKNYSSDLYNESM